MVADGKGVPEQLSQIDDQGGYTLSAPHAQVDVVDGKLVFIRYVVTWDDKGQNISNTSTFASLPADYAARASFSTAFPSKEAGAVMTTETARRLGFPLEFSGIALDAPGGVTATDEDAIRAALATAAPDSDVYVERGFQPATALVFAIAVGIVGFIILVATLIATALTGGGAGDVRHARGGGRHPADSAGRRRRTGRALRPARHGARQPRRARPGDRGGLVEHGVELAGPGERRRRADNRRALRRSSSARSSLSRSSRRPSPGSRSAATRRSPAASPDLPRSRVCSWRPARSAHWTEEGGRAGSERRVEPSSAAYFHVSMGPATTFGAAPCEPANS